MKPTKKELLSSSPTKNVALKRMLLNGYSINESNKFINHQTKAK